ncbi:MAG TPA: RNA polymerase sigma factor region1.1 domain-containing protein, partial [Gemmatimonadales bacterium]|nr:RNA polymerase sigma factor region1.1 domain-containing protein [Gemmatimonadales bacterium]
MKNPAGFIPAKPASDVQPSPLQADGLNEARNEATEVIAAKGRERGFVTSEDVLGGLPELELAPEQIEEFLSHVEHVLRDEGIEVIDVPGEAQEGGVETNVSRRHRREDLLKSPAYDPVRMYLKEIG